MFSNSHLHSIYSDGESTPAQLVDMVKRAGYRALILTDHDTMRGYHLLQLHARRARMLTMLGCEVTTTGFGSESIHVLAIDFDPENEAMRAIMRRGADRQTKRSEQLFLKGLENGSLREGTTWDEVRSAFPNNDFFCNSQVFDVLVKKGIYRLEERKEYWNSVFAYHLPASKELDMVLPSFSDVEEAISTIRRAGGVPMIAHPHGFEKYAEDMIKMGVLGFETHHPELDSDDIAFFTELCEENRLYMSGGTDHERIYPIESAVGYASEENFMKLYHRELG